MEHSLEPWQQHLGAISAGGDPIAVTISRRTYWKDSPRYPELAQLDEENARRIVTCVNFCVGISTEVLERDASPPMKQSPHE